MTLPISGQHRLTPFSEGGKPAAEQVTYLFRTPRQREKIQYRHRIFAEGGRRHSVLDMLALLRKGVLFITDPAEMPGTDPEVLAEQRAQTLALIDSLHGELLDFYGRMRDGEFNLATEDGLQAFQQAYGGITTGDDSLAPIAEVVGRYYRPYAVALADLSAYPDIVGQVAADLFLVGWENVKDPASPTGAALKFRRGTDGLSDEMLAAIRDGHLREMGLLVERLLEPTVIEAKNSESPRPSPSAPAISVSTAAASPTTTGATATTGATTEPPQTDPTGNSSANVTPATPG